MDHLGQDGFVELDERRTAREQMVDLLAQHPHHVVGEGVARGVGPVGDALEPHHAREAVGARDRDLHRALGQAPREGQLVRRDRPAAGQLPEHRGVTDLRRGDVERAELLLQLGRVVDERQEVGQRDQTAVVEAPADEVRVRVAALLAVGHDVGARPLLGRDGEAHRVVARGVEVGVREASLDVLVDRGDEPARPGPRPDAHRRERGDRRGRGGPGQRRGDRDGRLRKSCKPGRASQGGCGCRLGREALRQGTLAHEERPDARRPRPRHQVVPGQAAPGGEVLLHARVGRGELQEPAAGQRVEVLPDQQEQPAPAVEVSAVEPRVRGERVPVHRVHGHGLSTRSRGSRRRGTRRASRRRRSSRRRSASSRRACAS